LFYLWIFSVALQRRIVRQYDELYACVVLVSPKKVLDLIFDVPSIEVKI
jgi:hypothetical protein